MHDFHAMTLFIFILLNGMEYAGYFKERADLEGESPYP